MAVSKRVDTHKATVTDWKAERIKYKSPKERAAINDRVPIEDRIRIVEERNLHEDSGKIPAVNTRFSEESQTYSIVSSLAFFFGSPVGAELSDTGSLEYQRNSEGLVRWRIDDFFKSREIGNVMVAICETVLGSDDEELINRVFSQIKNSTSLSIKSRKTANKFFEKLLQYRKATQASRQDEILAQIQALQARLDSSSAQTVSNSRVYTSKSTEIREGTLIN